MRIQNNITAMNTHRQYTINNENVAKNAEKLSSGYRINRAGDDAAGLAISEKMRSQIRGLSMATKNSQDAISLVQTAEGALQETQNMLQRMNELAVQAATGTNEELDRSALAKEFEQLKREINDVAEQTNFNNMTILDGSLSYDGYKRSAQTAGVTKTVGTTLEGAGSAGSSAGVEFLGQTKGEDAKTFSQGMIGINLSGTTFTTGETITLDIEVNGTKVTATHTVVASDDLDKVSKGLADSLTSGLQAEGLTFTASQNAAKNGIEFKATDTNDGKFVDLRSADIKTEISITPATGSQTASSNVSVAGVVAGDHQSSSTATQAAGVFKLDPATIKVGDKITIGSGDNAKTFEVIDSNDSANASVSSGDLVGDNVAIAWDGDKDTFMTQFLAAINDTTNSLGNDLTAAPVSGVDGMFSLTATSTGALNGAAGNAFTKDGAISITSADGTPKASQSTPGLTTIEFDFAKLKDGDKVSFTIGGEKVEITKRADHTRASFMEELASQVGKTNEEGITDAKVSGNAVIIQGGVSVSDIEFEDGLEGAKTNAVRIQVGALENQQLSVSIDAMNTKGLGLDDSSLTVLNGNTDDNIDAAGRAITATRAAINKVSDQRATLGAMQNRLDHKIANLKVTTENLSAAESRIRDVDMAQEMTQFTKNNILSQAATAMLAQANALPQNVLSLLG